MALMAASGRLAAAAAAAGGVTPSTPPGMVPVYQKPAADKRRRRPPGAKPGHTGVAAEAAGERRREGRAPARRLPVLRRRPATVRPDPQPGWSRTSRRT